MRPESLPARVLFTLIMFAYPRVVRKRFAEEMRLFVSDSYSELVGGDGGSAVQGCGGTAARRYGGRSTAAFWFRTYWLLLMNGFGCRLDRRRSRRTARKNPTSPAPDPMRRIGILERGRNLARHLKHAIRSLRRTPGFALTCVLTLGLGIGACTTIFCVVYPVLLSPLPYPETEEIVSLHERSPGPDGRRSWVSPLTLRDWKERSRQFERIASWRLNIFTWTGGPEPALLQGWAVSAGYFPTLGLPMTLGRGFASVEEQPGNERVVVLSHGFWNLNFGGDSAVLGQSIILDGVPYTVVGVANPDIEYPPGGDYWIPATFDYDREYRDFRYLGVIGRLRDDVSLADGQTELAQLSETIASENPETNAGWSAEVRGLKDTQVAGVRPILLGMTVAVGLLLLIAVGNVTNLAIGRSTNRQTDFAVRRALGASNTAIVGMCITESLVMATLGSVLGVILAAWGTNTLATIALRSLPYTSSIAVDARALAFALCAAALVGLLLGLLSAATSASNNLGETLKAGGRGGGSTKRTFRVRESVLTEQVGMALALLIGATLLAQSLYNLSRTDVGFTPDDLLTFSYDLPGAWDQDAGTLRLFYNDALGQIVGVPGIQAAAAVTPMPMEMGSAPSSWSLTREVAGWPDPTVMAHMRTVTPGYFDTMGIRLVAGRAFDQTDREDTEQVALVNRAFVNRYLQGRSALGVRITAGDADADESDWSTIVGVVQNVRFRSLTTEGEPEIYIPMQQFPSGWGHLVVRSHLPRDVLARAVIDAVQQVEPDLPLANIKSGEEIIADQSRVSRISTTITSLFAFMAAVLAAVGILGMLSIVVAQRTKELGLRIALGADSGSIWRIVLLRGMRPVLFGLALGIAISLATTRFLESQIHNVSTLDPLAFLLPAIGFTILGLLACVVPSVRASRVDPVGLLRAE